MILSPRLQNEIYFEIFHRFILCSNVHCWFGQNALRGLVKFHHVVFVSFLVEFHFVRAILKP
jgi:hypothetical protein